jgi:dienelactone hydrolase
MVRRWQQALAGASTLAFVLLSAACATPSASFEAVELTGHDGVMLTGRLYGSGETAIVLAHMAGPESNQVDWAPVAERVAAAGHLVLTFNRAGVCDPDGSTCSDRRGGAQEGWADMLAAADYLRAAGAARVIVGGASLGAMAALRAAEEDPSIDGVIWFAGGLRGSSYDFNPDDVALVDAPMLLMSSIDDPLVNPSAVELLGEWATAPTRVVLLESDRHGTDVLEAGDAAAETVIREIEDFVAGVHQPAPAAS